MGFANVILCKKFTSPSLDKSWRCCEHLGCSESSIDIIQIFQENKKILFFRMPEYSLMMFSLKVYALL